MPISNNKNQIQIDKRIYKSILQTTGGTGGQILLTDFDNVPNRVKTIFFNQSVNNTIQFTTDAPNDFLLYNELTRTYDQTNVINLKTVGVYDLFPDNNLTSIYVVPRSRGVQVDSYVRMVNATTDLTINYNNVAATNFSATLSDTSFQSQYGLFTSFSGGIATLYTGKVLLGCVIPFILNSNNGGLQCNFSNSNNGSFPHNSYANVESTTNSARGVLINQMVYPTTTNLTWQVEIRREQGNNVTAAANVLPSARFYALRVG